MSASDTPTLEPGKVPGIVELFAAQFLEVARLECDEALERLRATLTQEDLEFLETHGFLYKDATGRDAGVLQFTAAGWAVIQLQCDLENARRRLSEFRGA